MYLRHQKALKGQSISSLSSLLL